MDYLVLSGMQFFAYHGVNEQENKVGNTFVVDLKIGGNFSKACQTDQLSDALDYASLYETIRHVMERPCKLLEHLAENICQQLKANHPQIDTIEIKVSKTNPPLIGQMDSASIILIR